MPPLGDAHIKVTTHFFHGPHEAERASWKSSTDFLSCPGIEPETFDVHAIATDADSHGLNISKTSTSTKQVHPQNKVHPQKGTSTSN